MTKRQIILRIAIIILIIEAIVMVSLNALALEISWIQEAIIDALSLTFFAAPVIHLWVIKPFVDMKEDAQSRIAYLAYHDKLTTLPNKLKLLDWLDHNIKIANKKSNFSVILLELDRLKSINDTFGHATVDSLILNMSAKLKNNVDKVELFARVDTYMFAFVVQDNISEDDLYLLSKKIVEIVEEPLYCANAHSFNIDGFIGISRFPEDAKNKDDMLKYAYTAIRHAKSNKEDRISFYTKSLTEITQRHFTLEEDLRNAVEKGEFYLLYQPKIDVKTTRIIGVEALIRWQHPKKGLISPDDFIPLAEETGLIIPISEWVLQEAIKQQERWENEGKSLITMSINLSAKQLQLDHIEHIIKILNLTNIPKQYIDFEITETYLMKDAIQSKMLLEKLHSIGVTLSIDDFGTGYSSLAYLKRFKVNTLKIDKALIQEIENNKNDFTIAKAIVAMAQALDMKVVAEGVETLIQSKMLKSINCDYIQGFYYSRPVNPNNVHFGDNYSY